MFSEIVGGLTVQGSDCAWMPCVFRCLLGYETRMLAG